MEQKSNQHIVMPKSGMPQQQMVSGKQPQAQGIPMLQGAPYFPNYYTQQFAYVPGPFAQHGQQANPYQQAVYHPQQAHYSVNHPHGQQVLYQPSSHSQMEQQIYQQQSQHIHQMQRHQNDAEKAVGTHIPTAHSQVANHNASKVRTHAMAGSLEHQLLMQQQKAQEDYEAAHRKKRGEASKSRVAASPMMVPAQMSNQHMPQTATMGSMNQASDLAVGREEQFKCDGCGVQPIQNVRFTCEFCEDFDLCSKCVGSTGCPKHSKTVMKQYKINSPTQLYEMQSKLQQKVNQAEMVNRNGGPSKKVLPTQIPATPVNMVDMTKRDGNGSIENVVDELQSVMKSLDLDNVSPTHATTKKAAAFKRIFSEAQQGSRVLNLCYKVSDPDYSNCKAILACCAMVLAGIPVSSKVKQKIAKFQEPEEKKKVATSLVLGLLAGLMEKDSDDVFCKPISTVEYPDYRRIVKKPIDLGTIHNHLSKSLATVKPEHDVLIKKYEKRISRVWVNAMTFNGKDHEYYKEAHQCDKYTKICFRLFESYLRVSTDLKIGHDSKRRRLNSTAASEILTNDEQTMDEDTARREIVKLKRQLRTAESTLEQLTKVIVGSFGGIAQELHI